MKSELTWLSTCLTMILVLSPFSLSAHDDHGHGQAAATAGSAHASGNSVSHDGMTTLYGHVQEMEKALSTGNHEGLHHLDSALRVDIKALEKDTSLTAAKQKRVQGYIKNVTKLCGKLHDAADANNIDQAKKELVKLKAQVDLLDKQFAHSHKPGADAQSAHEGTAKPVEK